MNVFFISSKKFSQVNFHTELLSDFSLMLRRTPIENMSSLLRVFLKQKRRKKHGMKNSFIKATTLSTSPAVESSSKYKSEAVILETRKPELIIQSRGKNNCKDGIKHTERIV